MEVPVEEKEGKPHFEDEPSACLICHNKEGNQRFTAQEKMFAQGGDFSYLVCGSCKAMMLLSPPEDMAPFYPKGYYSFVPSASKETVKTKVQDMVVRGVIAYRTGQPSILGAILGKWIPKFLWMRKGMLKWDTPILDVGCGHGALLLYMQRAGFTDLTGADPYVAETINYETGVRIEKKELGELDRTFGFIMLNHTFEHLAEPAKVMRQLSLRLDPGGQALIRIPVGDSFAWKHYGTDWVQLDAPRHFFLHTLRSMELLVNKAGLILDHVQFDSTEFQFVGSEKYKRSLPLDAPADFLSKSEIRAFRKKASVLNKNKQGDTASFYLRKA